MVASKASHHAQLLRGLLDMCLLAVIDHEPSYGYELVSKLNDRHLEIASEASIYPVLRRLQEQEWIESFLVESKSGPARKYYRTTGEGKATLDDWIADWRTVKSGVDDVLGATHH